MFMTDAKFKKMDRFKSPFTSCLFFTWSSLKNHCTFFDFKIKKNQFEYLTINRY